MENQSQIEQRRSQSDKNYEILNIDYNNIQNGQQLSTVIIEYKAIIDQMIKQIHELITLRDKQEDEKQIIINRMQQNKTNNANKIQYFKDQIYKVNEKYQSFLKQSFDENEKAKKNIELQHQLQMTQFNKQIQELEAEYKGLRQHQEREARYLQQIQQMKKQIILRQYQHHDNMNKEESFQLKENTELQYQKQQNVLQTKKNAHNQAVKKVSEQVSKNQAQNSQLKAKLIKLQGQLSKLKKERNDIVNKRKELKINISINEQELQEYKAVGSLQKAKIKAYKDKVQNIKILISEQVSKRQSIINQRKKQKEGSLKTLKLKLFNLEKEKQELKLRMEKMKILGQTILDQRSEVQDFFVMAMDVCKKQVEAYDNKAFKTEKQEKHYGEKVDLEDLLPQDKQRIVTNLYTKLAFGSK